MVFRSTCSIWSCFFFVLLLFDQFCFDLFELFPSIFDKGRFLMIVDNLFEKDGCVLEVSDFHRAGTDTKICVIDPLTVGELVNNFNVLLQRQSVAFLREMELTKLEIGFVRIALFGRVFSN